MNLGQLLGGAGVVGQGWREEEDAQRHSRALELRIAELNRLDRFRQEMLQAQMPTPVAVPQFGPIAQLPVVGAPAAPAAVTAPTQPVPTAQAAPTTRVQTFPVAPQPEITSRPIPASPLPTDAPAAERKDIMDRLAAARRELDQLRGPWYLPTPAGNRNRIAQLEQQIVGLQQEYQQRVVPAARAEYQRVNPQYRYPEQLAEEDAARRRAQLPPTPQLPDTPSLLQAMIKVESAGNPGAVSDKGAVGLMQVLPSTAMDPGFGLPNVFDFAQQMGTQVGRRNEAEAKRLLADPTVGAAYGQRYMDAMLKRYNGNLEYALAAYNAGPGRIDKWLADGADFKKLPKQTREYIPKVLAALSPAGAAPAAGGAPAAPAPIVGLNIPGIGAAQAAGVPAAAAGTPPAPMEVPRTQARNMQMAEFYLANPQSIPLDMQRAMQQRSEIERLAGMYQRAGMGAQFMEARAKLMELDNGMTYLQGMQGLRELTTANDPRRLSGVLSQYMGVPVGIQPRSDGAYNYFVNGQRVKEGVSPSELASMALREFSSEARQVASASAQLENELALKRKYGDAVVNAMRDIQKAIVEGEYKIAEERAKQAQGKLTVDSSMGVAYFQQGNRVFVINPDGKVEEIGGLEVETPPTARPVAGLNLGR